jgi:hypothetical protein
VTTQLARDFAGHDVAFVYLQTTFEGFSSNDFERARSEQRKWRIRQPVGHDVAADPADPRSRPNTMRDYRTGGTPWTVIIDKQGVIRFNDFTRDVVFHRRMITALL